MSEQKTRSEFMGVPVVQPSETIPTSLALVPTVTLAGLTAEIQKAHAAATQGLSQHLAHAIAAGEALLKAKEFVKKEVGHGAWQDYITVECRLIPRVAQNYMNLAKKKDELLHLLGTKTNSNSVLTQTQALKLLSSAKKKGRAKPKRSEKPK
jgi:hypothetical protein